MGCFNSRGYLSRVSIVEGDDVVAMIGLVKSNLTDKYYTLDNIVPAALPVYGKYNDYGSVNSIEETSTSKWFDTNICPVEDVFSLISRLRGLSLVDFQAENLEYSTHPKDADILSNLISILGQDAKLCILLEHREVYENWICQSQYEEKLRGILSEGDKFMFVMNLEMFFGPASYDILKLQYSEDLFKNNIEEIIKLQKHILWIENHELLLDVPVQGSQETGYSDSLEYHAKCIDLIQRKQSEYLERMQFSTRF